MLTVPTGTPALPATITAMSVNATERLGVEQVAVAPGWAVSVVVVFTLCACAATTASVDAASVILNPATSSSRRLRQKIPLTCTCSRIQNRVLPHAAA
jgi:hypothetical protein